MDLIMELPDIAGYSIKDARTVLDQSGWQIDNITILKPPRETIEKYDESFRIIKVQKVEEKKLGLLVCKPF